MCTILGYGLPERETYCILHVYKAFAFSSFYRIPSALPLQSLEDCTVTHTVYIMYECIVRPGRIWHKKVLYISVNSRLFSNSTASRNFNRGILGISCFTVWKRTASGGWKPREAVPSQAVPGKYFRPHLVNRRRFQPACCFTAGKSDARRNLLQPVPGFTSVQRMQTKLTPIFSNGCV